MGADEMDGGFQVEGDLQNILLIDGAGGACTIPPTGAPSTAPWISATPRPRRRSRRSWNMGVAGTVTYCTK
jgi:hypothetical protein